MLLKMSKICHPDLYLPSGRILKHFAALTVINYEVMLKQLQELTVREGCVAVVTGGADGIGLEVTRKLAQLGVTVVIGSRDKDEAQTCIAEIAAEEPDSKVLWIYLDLADFDSIHSFANGFHKLKLQLNILVNNAGVMMCPYSQTRNGVELQFGTNYLGHVVLTHLLLDKLRTSGTNASFSRIVNVSSDVHHTGSMGDLYDTLHGNWYSPHAAYAQSKLALVLWTHLLNRTFQQSGNLVTCNALHPGIVKTSLYRHVHWTIWLFLGPLATLSFMTPEEAADQVIFAALANTLEARGGLYLDNCQCVKSSSTSYCPDKQWALWKWTKDFIKSAYEFLEGDEPDGFDRDMLHFQL